MVRYYKGQITGNPQVANIGGISYSALDVNYSGLIIFKCDVDTIQHQSIIDLGNTEIPYANLKSESDIVFNNLYAQTEIDDWK